MAEEKRSEEGPGGRLLAGGISFNVWSRRRVGFLARHPLASFSPDNGRAFHSHLILFLHLRHLSPGKKPNSYGYCHQRLTRR